MTDDERLAKLPPAARAAFARAVEALKKSNAGQALTDASAAVAAAGVARINARAPLFPLPASLDDVQRAALEYSAVHDLGVWPYACPKTARTRRRWLGIDPPGVLETHAVTIEHEGGTTTEPLWRALQIAGEIGKQAAVLDALPFELALQALGELYTVGSGYGLNMSLMFPHGNLRLLRELRDEGRAWAIEQADRICGDRAALSTGLRSFVFFALVRAKVPIEPRWDVLFLETRGATKELLIECAAALPEGRRAAVVGPRLASTPWRHDILAALPDAAMARALVASAEPNSDAWNFHLARLRELGKTHAEIARAVEEIVAATPKPIELYVTRLVKPKRMSALTPLEREQLRIGVRGFDPEAEADLAKPGASLDGWVEMRAIADADGAPLYDAFLYVDAGVIFRAGTTEELGWRSQGGVVLKEKNDALRVALETAVGPNARRAERR